MKSIENFNTASELNAKNQMDKFSLTEEEKSKIWTALKARDIETKKLKEKHAQVEDERKKEIENEIYNKLLTEEKERKKDILKNIIKRPGMGENIPLIDTNSLRQTAKYAANEKLVNDQRKELDTIAKNYQQQVNTIYDKARQQGREKTLSNEFNRNAQSLKHEFNRNM